VPTVDIMQRRIRSADVQETLRKASGILRGPVVRFKQSRTCAKEEEAVMTSIVCVGVAFLVSWAALVQERKAQEAGELAKARAWLLVAVLSGLWTVLWIAAQIDAVLQGPV
jgi:hypothetical protein